MEFFYKIFLFVQYLYQYEYPLKVLPILPKGILYCNINNPAKRQLNHFTHLYTTMQQSLHWLQWDASHPPSKLPLDVEQSPTPTICLILGSSQSITPKGIQIQSAFFHNTPDRQMEGRTD